MSTAMQKLSGFAVALLCGINLNVVSVQASSYNATVSKQHVSSKATYWQRHPKVKAATVGAGVGTAAGALTGLVTRKGVVKGAAIGAGTGAGVGLIRSSHTMKRHPIMKDVATGSAIGLGLGMAGGRGRHHNLKATGVGAAIGLGVGLVKNLR